jgi:beta-lactamase class A
VTRRRFAARLGTAFAIVLLTAACSDSVSPSAAGTATSADGSTGDPVASSAPTATTTTSSPARVPAAVTASRLQSIVDEFAAAHEVPFSIVAIDLSTGARADHLSDRVVPSASLYKLFVASELQRRIDGGALSPDAPAGDGNGRTVQQCIHDMIVVSDNPCGSAGLRIVGQGALDRSLHANGYISTSLDSPQQTSADDVALFLQRAHDDPAPRPLYALLQQQQVNDRLPKGLPTGTAIAHKTGDRLRWAHDAGVISTPHGDVLLVALSGPWSLPCCDADKPGPAEAVAFGAIADLGRAVYDAVA